MSNASRYVMVSRPLNASGHTSSTAETACCSDANASANASELLELMFELYVWGVTTVPLTKGW
ncbi:hypothetical protein MYIN104542_27040 [Mycobacterium intermedium]